MKTVIISIFSLVSIASVATAGPNSKSSWNELASSAPAPQYRAFVFPVATLPDASVETQTLAKELGKELPPFHYSGIVSIADPRGCYLSIAVEKTLNDSGFIIDLRASGGSIYATDNSQLRRAIHALLKTMKHENGGVLLPVPSIITSYPAITVKDSN